MSGIATNSTLFRPFASIGSPLILRRRSDAGAHKSARLRSSVAGRFVISGGVLWCTGSTDDRTSVFLTEVQQGRNCFIAAVVELADTDHLEWSGRFPCGFDSRRPHYMRSNSHSRLADMSTAFLALRQPPHPAVQYLPATCGPSGMKTRCNNDEDACG